MKKIYFILAFITILAAFTTSTLRLNAQTPIWFEPSALEASLPTNDSIVVHSVLHNGSDYTLDFSFPGYTSKGQGGPDDYGYTWIDSQEDGGPNWEYTDISETGELVEGLGYDQVAGPFEIGFGFSYYGQEKNHFWISSNGVISFNEQFVTFVNQPIPTNSNYIDFIAWFWDDLEIDTAISRVYVKHFEEKTVIQFTKMVHYPGTESFITGQVILVNNGTILIKYRLVSENFDKNNATVGLQSWNPEMGLQVVYNAEYVHSELAVRFDLHRNFIVSVTPSTLTLQPGSQETIWITYSSVGFETGAYEQDLKCLTSHPEIPYVMLHNVMHVTNDNQAGFKGYVTDAVTGFAINDALVKVGDHQTYSNDNGFYELPLEAGEYNIQFLKDGYQTRGFEDTTALAGFSIIDVELEPVNPTYFLVGRVYAGDNFLESGFAYGYKMIEEEVIDVYADMVGEEGWYEFTGLTPAGYIVKAEPSVNSQFYGSFLPTYYGDVLHWEDATVINLTGNTDGAHIHLIAEVSAPTGPGSISGTISNSNRTADVPVILRTHEPEAVVMTLTAADGTFAFNDLAYGTYEIFAEIPGKSITPMSIEVNEVNPSVEITDISGRVANSESYDISGMKVIRIDATDLSNGVYFIKIDSGNEVIFKKIIKN
jgi:hypothetical protein